MTDGHTEEGSYPVNIELTGDEVEMGIRAMRTALLFSGSGENSSGTHLDEVQLVAFRRFVTGIIEKFETARDKQKP